MNSASVYMDESYVTGSIPMLCVAGFLFEGENASQLDSEWKAVLNREGMPYMRMSLFTKDGQEPYAHLPMTRRDEIARELISIIGRHRSLAFAVGIEEKLCERLFPEYLPPTDKGKPLSAYGWCLVDCCKLSAQWARNHNFRGEISYFFESGHKDRKDANAALNAVFEDDAELRKKVLRYRGHSFIDKADTGALQAADMLAWLAGKWFKKGRPGLASNMRKDLQELLAHNSPQHRASIHWWTEPRLRAALAGTMGAINDINVIYASLALQDAQTS